MVETYHIQRGLELRESILNTIGGEGTRCRTRDNVNIR